MILSPHALSYARYALESLLHNALEPFCLHLVTDSAEDKGILSKEVSRLSNPAGAPIHLFAKDELKEREEVVFRGYPNLRAFRKGHPCWRKITDPLLLTGPDEEMILLDPDLYFPNRFTFEPTPDRGLLLMWQKPNCLLPPEVVTAAFSRNIPLANHVDIGVAHWKAPVDLDWLNWLIGELGGERLPRLMHIEAIVWAALAMRIGGGYLSPDHWRCWRRSQWKRAARKIGISGKQILRFEPYSTIKCFHAGGEAKHWLAEAAAAGWMGSPSTLAGPCPALPPVELTHRQYLREQTIKTLLRKVGYYQVFQSV